MEQTTTATAPEQPKHSPITRTVFDLSAFEEVKLSKPFVAPAKPGSVAEALVLVGNDSEKLLNLIYDGLLAEARDVQSQDIAGFVVEDEEGNETPYTGKYADDKKTKIINGAVLNTAKMFAGGSWDSLKLDQKKVFKAQVVAMLRATPAALASLTGEKVEVPTAKELAEAPASE